MAVGGFPVPLLQLGFGCKYKDFTSLKQSFSHIMTCQQEIPNLYSIQTTRRGINTQHPPPAPTLAPQAELNHLTTTASLSVCAVVTVFIDTNCTAITQILIKF